MILIIYLYHTLLPMKNICNILIVSIVIIFNIDSFAQNKLRQGAFFSEKEGLLEHNHLQSLYLTKKDWTKRATLIKKGILEGAELTKFKTGAPIKATIHSKKIMDGYTVENVFFESVPGIYVTGNLYKPLQTKPKMPAVLRPHGHFEEARFSADLQKSCGLLARMGAIVFTYDMVGYSDMQQCDHKIPKAFKLQLINSLRSLDFLSSLPEVDAAKIGITGESGGGTQTFMLCAIDNRPLVSVPVVMVSAHFFGGCVCESGMPVHERPSHHTTNVEIAACHAPKPMALVSVGGDWTKNTPQVELPHIQHVYELYGKQFMLENSHFALEKHDYGPSKREAAIGFLAKYLNLDMKAYDETKVQILAKADLTVFNSQNPLPTNAVKGNEKVMQAIDKQ